MLTAQQIISKLKQREDVIYVRSELRKHDRSRHDAIMNGYMEKWREGVNSEAVEQKKQNAGRRKGNNWLRELKL